MNLVDNKVIICSLASGSNGNAYYIAFNDEAILIDCGITYRQLTTRARRQGVDLRTIKHVFITHEHSDHVRGLRGLTEHCDCTCYMTRGTAEKSKSWYLPENPPIAIHYGDITEVGPFRVHCFQKPHDVKEPCSFRVEVNGINIGVFTDIGAPCDELKAHLHECHAAFLESNYDVDMLWAGKYPLMLKQRVTCGTGHLSNVQSAQLVADVDAPHLHTIILSHISEHNNHPHIAKKAFERFGDKYKVLTASRYEAGPVFIISEDNSEEIKRPL